MGVRDSVDVIVVGSGGGALTAAITARSNGLETLVLEKTAKIGGTTSLSGGLLWIPNNPVMREQGVADSFDAASKYLDALVDGADPASFKVRRDAYVRQGSRMIDLLRSHGMPFDPCAGYPDYYMDLPGAALGRPLEPRPFDTNRLGPWRGRLRPQTLLPRFLKIRTSEFTDVSLARRSVKGALALSRVASRSAIAAARGASLVVGGEALVAQLLAIAVELGVDIRTDSPMVDLWQEDGRVVGVTAEQAGTLTRIRAPRGVIFAAGGYAHNNEMRAAYARQPSSSAWTKANEGETGEALQVAMRAGAATYRIEEFWFSPMSRMPNGAMIPHNTDRTKPHSIIVDDNGNRFVSEAANYNEIGQRIYAHAKNAPAIPSWLVFDSNHRRKYPFFTAPPRRMPPDWIESGYIKKADTLAELGRVCNIDAGRLVQTVERFNEMVRAGHDDDFGRGDNAYELYLGDPGNKPNPTLGEVARAPFYAVALYPGDLGSCGGLVTDEDARVLRDDGTAIDGLYAAGNITAPIAAGKYWGAGASIGASMTFGFVAAERAATREVVEEMA